MEKIVFLDQGTIKIAIRKPSFPHAWERYDSTAPAEVVARLKDATIAITNKVKLGPAEIDACPSLKLIALSATGFDNVHIDTCRKRGIAVCNVPHYTNESLPEQVFLYLLALRRSFFQYRDAVETGAWPKSVLPAITAFPIQDLRGSVLGIIGYGELGKRVAELAKAFGMTVWIAERKGATSREGRVSFEKVISEADAITLHCPMTPDTRDLINRETLAQMKPSAILVNTARGGLVDGAALAEALTAKRIAGAALDVLNVEPPPADHPLLQLHLPNLIITPHNAWASDHSLAVLTEQLIQNLEAFVSGHPINRVV